MPAIRFSANKKGSLPSLVEEEEEEEKQEEEEVENIPVEDIPTVEVIPVEDIPTVEVIPVEDIPTVEDITVEVIPVENVTVEQPDSTGQVEEQAPVNEENSGACDGCGPWRPLTFLLMCLSIIPGMIVYSIAGLVVGVFIIPLLQLNMLTNCTCCYAFRSVDAMILTLRFRKHQHIVTGDTNNQYCIGGQLCSSVWRIFRALLYCPYVAVTMVGTVFLGAFSGLCLGICLGCTVPPKCIALWRNDKKQTVYETTEKQLVHWGLLEVHDYSGGGRQIRQVDGSEWFYYLLATGVFLWIPLIMLGNWLPNGFWIAVLWMPIPYMIFLILKLHDTRRAEIRKEFIKLSNIVDNVEDDVSLNDTQSNIVDNVEHDVSSNTVWRETRTYLKHKPCAVLLILFSIVVFVVLGALLGAIVLPILQWNLMTPFRFRGRFRSVDAVIRTLRGVKHNHVNHCAGCHVFFTEGKWTTRRAIKAVLTLVYFPAFVLLTLLGTSVVWVIVGGCLGLLLGCVISPQVITDKRKGDMTRDKFFNIVETTLVNMGVLVVHQSAGQANRQVDGSKFFYFMLASGSFAWIPVVIPVGIYNWIVAMTLPLLMYEISKLHRKSREEIKQELTRNYECSDCASGCNQLKHLRHPPMFLSIFPGIVVFTIIGCLIGLFVLPILQWNLLTRCHCCYLFRSVHSTILTLRGLKRRRITRNKNGAIRRYVRNVWFCNCCHSDSWLLRIVCFIPTFLHIFIFYPLLVVTTVIGTCLIGAGTGALLGIALGCVVPPQFINRHMKMKDGTLYDHLEFTLTKWKIIVVHTLEPLTTGSGNSVRWVDGTDYFYFVMGTCGIVLFPLIGFSLFPIFLPYFVYYTAKLYKQNRQDTRQELLELSDDATNSADDEAQQEVDDDNESNASNQNFPLSPEEENFVRVAFLLIDEGSVWVRRLLYEKLQGNTLKAVLETNRSVLTKAGRYGLNPSQISLMFPNRTHAANSAQAADSAQAANSSQAANNTQAADSADEFDLTLLVNLFRICGVLSKLQPNFNWFNNNEPKEPDAILLEQKDPKEQDYKYAVTLVKMRQMRNRLYAHVADCMMEKEMFDQEYPKVRQILEDLGATLQEIDESFVRLNLTRKGRTECAKRLTTLYSEDQPEVEENTGQDPQPQEDTLKVPPYVDVVSWWPSKRETTYLKPT